MRDSKWLLYPKMICFLEFAQLVCSARFTAVVFALWGFDPELTGTLLSVVPVVGIFGSLTWATVADRLRSTRLLLVCIVLASALAFGSLHFLRDRRELLVLMLAAYSFCVSGIEPIVNSWAIHYIAARDGDPVRQWGRQRVFGAAAWGLCGLALGWLTTRYGTLSVFAGFVGSSVLFAAIVLAAPSVAAPAPAARPARTPAASPHHDHLNSTKPSGALLVGVTDDSEHTDAAHHHGDEHARGFISVDDASANSDASDSDSDDSSDDHAPFAHDPAQGEARQDEGPGQPSPRSNTRARVPATGQRAHRRHKSSRHHGQQSALQVLCTPLRSVRAFVFYVYVFCQSVGMGVVQSLLLYYIVHSLNSSATLAGVSLFVTVLPELVLYPLQGVVVTYVGVPGCFALGAAAMVTRFCIYPLLTPATANWVLAAEPLHGVTTGFFYVTAVTYAGSSHISDARNRATAQAWVTALHDGAGLAVGSSVGGLLYQRYSPAVMFHATALFVGTSTLVYLLCALALGECTRDASPVGQGAQRQHKQEKARGSGVSTIHAHMTSNLHEGVVGLGDTGYVSFPSSAGAALDSA